MRGESREGSRPPGGKSLIRLLQLLESAGYTGAASVAIQTAVREQDREEFREVTEQFSLIPSDETPDREASPGPSHAGRRCAARSHSR